MINVINTGALKSIPLSQFTAADFGYVGDVERLPVERAYREVGWYRRALDLRANGVVEMPYDLRRGDSVVYDEKANSEDIPAVLNVFPLLGALTRDIDKYGAAYAVFETDVFGYKKAWRRLHPASIVPRYNESTGELLYFERQYGYGQKASKYKFELDELLWLWMPPDATENRPGAGVGFTALLAATGMANKDKFSAYYFERGAINPTLVKVKGFATLPQDEKDRVSNVFQKLMGGIRNAFKVTPIDGDIDVFNLMSSLKDMALESMTTQQREDIATTLGIPLSLLMSNAANYATARQDDINFYDKTISPFYREVIAPQLNQKLFSQAGFNLLPVKKRLEAFQRQESEKAYAMVPLYTQGVFSLNEVREDLGKDPLPEDHFNTPGQGQSPQGGQGMPKPPAGEGIDMGDAMRDESKALKPSPLEALTPDPSPDGRGETDTVADIEKWERMAVKRWDEDKRDKMLVFESAVIPSTLKAAIIGGLEVAATVDDVRLIFSDARQYVEVH